jgi:hypothetical protein
MIGPPPGARVWLACGHTDMRKGMDGLAGDKRQLDVTDSAAIAALRMARVV